MKELFQNKVFRIIMTTDAIQLLCIWIRNMAVLFFIIEKTNANPIAISLITIFEYLPIFVFSYLGGTLADKWNPKRTMIAGDFLSSISVVVILLLINQGLWQTVFAATLVSSMVSQFSAPSSVIMFKRNIDEQLITPAISLSQGLQSLYLIIGPIIGTLLYKGLGISFSLTIIAILFLCSAMVQFLLPASPRKADYIKPNLLAQMKEGLVYINNDKGLTVLCSVLGLFGFAQGLIQPLTIFILTDRLRIETESLQWFYSLSGVGLLIGAIISMSIVSKYKTRMILFLGMIAFAAVTIAEALSTVVILTAMLYFLSGLIIAFVQVAISVPLIQNVQEDYIGRINGLITPLLIAGILIGTALSGVLIEQLTLIPVFMLSAFTLIICGVISLGYQSAPEPVEFDRAP
ncbi:MFS transporter [Acetobacterium sp.]|jgi:predicted MFS family arabinose efflux permease|uniref:MFS transporter n=1 Tax=Acetobacterium sp. TaxID=1872094 RepID=UPI002725B494|nr:MFS transporter [Acetobacterium sp.]MDO9490907.1 MFS transporter [Acetobacterium sp.]